MLLLDTYMISRPGGSGDSFRLPGAEMNGASFNVIFEGTVPTLHQAELLDVSIIHGDGRQRRRGW